jgi:hypothetical protein
MEFTKDALSRAFAGGDDFGVHAGEVQAAAVAGVFHLDAFVDDDGEAGGEGALGGGQVAEPELHPDRGRIDALFLARDGLADDFIHVLRRAEDVDDIDGEGDARKIGINFFAEDGFGLRIHGHDAVTLILEVARDEVARLLPIAGKPDDRDRLRCVQQVIDLRHVLITRALFGRQARVERDSA